MPDKFKVEGWSLEDLFSDFDSPPFKKTLKDFENDVRNFETYRSQLNDDLTGQTLLEILWSYDHLDREISRIYGFASLSFAANSQDQNIQNQFAQVRQIAADAENRTLFFNLWWKSLDDKAAQRLLKESDPFTYWLFALRQQSPYTLSEPEERIINLKDVNGSQALMTLMSTITDRYVFNLEIAAEKKELTGEELRSHFYDTDPNIRQAAYQEYLRVYQQDKNILGQIYQYRVRDWHSEQIKLRSYKSPIAARNLNNDIPDEVVELLLDVCRNNAPLFQRYFKVKAKWLGMTKLRRYDVLAPVLESDRKYTYQEAVNLVLSSFQEFNPRFSELAKRVISEHHLDSEVRKGKRGGAFCSTISPDFTPWVLLTFRGKSKDVATIAHELGHAVHSMLASHHSALTQHASLPLAETASTFGEMIVTNRLQREDPDPSVKTDLIFRDLDRNYSTIMRQAFFAIFEKEAHESIKQGAGIDDISNTYFQNLVQLFGDSIELAEEFKLEWISVPHFYRVPFYVYAYAFGQLLVLSLYQQYLTEGEAFVPRFMDILSAGGSDRPMNILKKAGIDASTADFWQGGFDLIEASIAQLENQPVPTLPGNQVKP